MTASKYWGEEKYPDAIYSIYLKKVRYVSPPVNDADPHQKTIDPEDSPDAADHLQWETIRERVIMAGTCQRLVESLVDSEGQLDSRQFNIFFATYRTFAKTEEVLNLIIEWYNDLSFNSQPEHSKAQTDRKQAMRSTIKSITICWLEMYPEDFYILSQTDESQETFGFPLPEKLIAFGKSTNLHDLKHKARKLRDRFKRIHESGGLPAQLPSIASISFDITRYDPNASSANTSSQFELEDDERYAKMLVEAQARAQMFDVSCDNVPQIAEQLTFWDALLFKDLKPYQCQGSIWGKRNKLARPELVYSVRATINQFNSLCQRVMTSIVLPECQTQFRAKIIEKWIHIAKELYLLKNFSSLKAVLSSLQSQPIFRLKNTWSLVSKISMVQFKELGDLIDLKNPEDAKNGRNGEGTSKSTPKKSPGGHCRRTKSDINIALETQGNVPYLGSFLTELQMIDQAYPDATPEGLINFDKRRQEFDVLAKLRLYQSAARTYTIPMDRAFCVWFNYLPALDEKECFIRSIEIEPNGESTPNTRRKAHEGMTKINSLGKLFSGLSYSTAKSNNSSLGNSSFFANSERNSFTKENEKRNSFGSCSMDASPVESNLTFKQFLEKPPRGTRSRSQGAKKENRCNQTTPKSRPIGQKRSPSVGRKEEPDEIDNLAEHEFLIGKPYPGSEFNPQQHFSNTNNSHQLNRNKNNDEAAAISTNFISGGVGLRQRRASDLECLDRMNSTDLSADVPPTFCSSSTSSSFGHPQMTFDQFTNNKVRSGGMSSAKGAVSNHPDANSQKDILERMKRFQKSTTSSSSRSSLGNNEKNFGGASPSSISVSNCPREEQTFHLIRVGLDDLLQKEHETTTNTNYKCIKVLNGDRMPQVIQRALEKHLIDPNESPNYCLVQLLPDGGEFRFPDHCNPFYAVAPDPSSPMLNCILRKRADCAANSSNPVASDHHYNSMAETKKLNKQKRDNLLRWSSGFL